MKLQTQEFANKIRTSISGVDPLAEVLLYGSRARGSERAESDWDVLVLTDYSVDLSKESKFREKIYDLELESGEPISIFVYSKDNWKTKQKITPFYQNVMQEAILL